MYLSYTSQELFLQMPLYTSAFYSVKQEVIEEKVRLLFNEFKSVLVRKDSVGGVIDMGAVSEGINTIKKSMYELYR